MCKQIKHSTKQRTGGAIALSQVSCSHLSFVICHLSFVICHLSFVICHLSLVNDQSLRRINW
ncbi:hypothetical protein FM036_07420 [Nostoc sp. HG1]|nr:hypothetical protein [Nostoc sp. HG1]